MSEQLDTSDPSWIRQDGTKKGMGFFGPLQFHDGSTSTELSIGVNIDGKQVEIPSLVPTLSHEEITHLLKGGEPTDDIVKKAADFAITRMKSGLPLYAGPDERVPMPNPAEVDLQQGYDSVRAPQ